MTGAVSIWVAAFVASVALLAFLSLLAVIVCCVVMEWADRR